MALEVFDYRNDIRNVFVSPQIRSRFLRMEPGTVADRHSHDLGHEIFLILRGKARFEDRCVWPVSTSHTRSASSATKR